MAKLGSLYFSILYKDDPKQLEAIKKRALKQLKSLEVKLNMSGTTSTAKRSNAGTKATQEEIGYIEQLIQRTKELEQQYKSLPKAADAKPIIQEFSQVKKELDKVGKSLVDASKKQNLAEGSILSYRAELSKLIYEYDRLSAAEREAAAGKELLKNIQQTTIKLNEAEQASMRYQRNVGNYKSGFNGLTFQVQQLARELPSIAYGANIFFAAISNNAPMFADEVKRANEEYKILRQQQKEGMNLNVKAVPVWRQVAASIFSWQTAFVAVVTVMTLFGAKIFEAIGNMFKFGSAAKLTGKEIKELGKSFAEASAKEIAQLDKLFENLDKTREGTAEWYDARAQILSQHGDILSAMGSEISSLNDKAGAYRVLRDEIYKTAKAEAVTKATQELQTKAIETAVQGYAKIYDEAVIKKGQKFADEFIKRVRNDIETTGKLSDELSKEIEQLFPMQFERVIGTGSAGNVMKTNAALNTVPITINNILKAENDLIKKRNEAESLFDWLKIDDKDVKQNKLYWENQLSAAQNQLDLMDDSLIGTEEWNKKLKEIEDIKAKIALRDKESTNETNTTNDILKDRVALLMEANSMYEEWVKIAGSDRAKSVAKAIYPEFNPDTLRSELEKIRKTGSKEARIEAAKALTGLDRQSVETTLTDVERQITETIAKWDLFSKLYKESGDYSFAINAVFGGKVGFKSVLEQLQKEIEDEIKGNKVGISFAELIKAEPDTVAKMFGGKTSALVKAYQEESKKLSDESLMRAAELLSTYKNYEQQRKDIIAQGEQDIADLMAHGASQAAIDEAKKRTQKSIDDLQKEVLQLYGLGGYAENGNISDYFKDAIKNVLPLYKSLNTATLSELKKAKDAISSMKVPPQLLVDFEAAGGAAEDLANVIKEAQDSAEEAIDDRILNELVESINKMINSVGKLGSALQKLNNKFLKSTGELLSAISGSMDGIMELIKLGEKATTVDVISAGLSGVSTLIDTIGTSIQNNVDAQNKWNEAIAESVQQMRLFNIERLAYEEGSIFGMDDPIRPALSAMEQLFAARKELSKMEEELGSGLVQTGTMRVPSSSAWGGFIAGGAGIGSAIGSIIPGIGTALGGLMGGLIGGISAGISSLFGSKASTKTIPVYNRLKDQYEVLYDPDTYELNPQLLADYDKLDEATKKIVDNWDEIKQKMEEADKQVETTLDSIAGSIGEDLYDALIEAFTNDDLNAALDEFRTNVNKMLSDLATRILFSAIFSDVLAEGEKRMKESLSPEGDQNLLDDIDWLGEQLENRLPIAIEGLEGVDKMLESLGRDLSFGEEAKDSGLTAGIKGITEDTASLLASYVNGIRADIAMQLDFVKRLIDSDVPEITALGKAQLIQLQNIARNTEKASKMAEDIMDFLNSVSAGTKSLKVK
jgi:hypothetical protein